MSTKTKIMAFVSLASLTMVLLMVGVWALKTVNFTVGGNLSYIAPGIEATISKGTMSNGVWVNAGDASTKMPLTQITRTDTEETLTEKFSYWQNLNLNFNEAGDDVTITFSITNDMAEKYLSINVTTSYTSADNATISINTSLAELEPDASQSFTITMKVTDKTANATLSSFAIVFHMEMADQPPTPAEDVSYFTFSYNDTTMTASVTGFNNSIAEVSIPARILYNSNTYFVTSIGNQAFRKKTALTSISIPEGVTSIGYSAFEECSSLTSISIPDSVTSVALTAFMGCAKLTHNTYDNAEYLGNSANPYVVLTSATSKSITSCTINSGCKVILGKALSSVALTSLIIPDSVINIESEAFYGCKGLTSVTIGRGLTSISDGAFADCTSLVKVEVGAKTVPTGGYGMFDDCPLTTGILVPTASVDLYKSATYWKDYNIVDGGF